ncbi:MAG: N-6 DNA methylase, partial [Candidatus Heimdallarchaeota archaeon]
MRPFLPADNVKIIYRKDLIEVKDLKLLFRKMRNQLAGNFHGTTRDERLAEQLIFLLFCKLKDELDRKPHEPVLFQLTYPEKNTVTERIFELFNQLKNQYKYIFSDEDRIIADKNSLELMVKEIEKYEITKASRDVIGDAFEAFLGPSLRGNKGQFFTPKNVVRAMIKILNPRLGERFIDPACGTGGFLVVGLAHHTKDDETSVERQSVSYDSFYGIDKDCFLAKIAQLYLAILGIEREVIYCENSLDFPEKWSSEAYEAIQLNSFDVVCTNPPFGAKIPIESETILENYHFGYKWKQSNGVWRETKIRQDKQPPQILFIERCLNLLKKGGRLGIILPDGIFGNPSDRYIMQFLLQQTKLIALISCSH